MLHGTGHTVLLIEADRSIRRLIAIGLEYRGMHVMEASSPGDLTIFETQKPGLVVLDIDGEAGSDHSFLHAVQAHPYLSTLPIVLLAWDSLEPMSSHRNTSQMHITCLTKPFDARLLYATIEHILGTSKEKSSTSKQGVLLAAHSEAPALSIWPLITAIGLLLLIIGLMTQITISALGLLIVIVALLWWTLGTKKEPEPLIVEIGNI
jgi:DNA-binding NtrC family response regulator